MGLDSLLILESFITRSIPVFPASRDGHTIQENTTVSSSLHLTAFGNDAISPVARHHPSILHGGSFLGMFDKFIFVLCRNCCN